jgi:hypothetical protein
MNKALSIALLIAGVILVAFGLSAMDSPSSDLSRLFSGAPTDKTIWLLVGGVVLAIIGLIGVLRMNRRV